MSDSQGICSLGKDNNRYVFRLKFKWLILILTTFKSNTPSRASCKRLTNRVVNKPNDFSNLLAAFRSPAIFQLNRDARLARFKNLPPEVQQSVFKSCDFFQILHDQLVWSLEFTQLFEFNKNPVLKNIRIFKILI